MPVVATIVVALAVAAMIALGIWQLQRRHAKEAAIARAAANLSLPAIALPAFGRFDEALLYRRVSGFCLQPTSWKAESGRAAGGVPGWRHIALCRTGAEGPGFAVDVGVSRDAADPRWRGGVVSGWLTAMPGDLTLIERALGRVGAPTPMIVSDRAAPGLQPSARPDPADISNNHLAYAVQWFVFAAIAALIYAIALWRRMTSDASFPT